MNRGGVLTGDPLLPGVARRVQDEGFDSAWILPYAHRPGVAESANEWSAANVPAYPWLVPGATFHPADDDMERLVSRALIELRLRVVKLHCSVGQFSPADPGLKPLWKTAAALGTPIVIHAGQADPGDTSPGEVERIADVLESFPGLVLVLAHCGHPNPGPALELMARYPTLCGDVTPVWDRGNALSAADLRRFPGRFLFGSDVPNCPEPTAQQIARFEAMGLPAEEFDLLMGGTAERLLAESAARQAG
jgi:uncharacterized protein